MNTTEEDVGFDDDEVDVNNAGEQFQDDVNLEMEGNTLEIGGQQAPDVYEAQQTTTEELHTQPGTEDSQKQAPTEEPQNQPHTGQADFSLVSSRKLESFPSAFGRPVFKKPPVMMNTTIHPPGTNVDLQQLMRSRLPSSSSLSEGEVPSGVEKIMDARMGAAETFASPVDNGFGKKQSSAATQPEPTQQELRQPLVGQEVVSAGPTMSSQSVLQAKDQNVMTQRSYGPAKFKPPQSTAASQTATSQTAASQTSVVQNVQHEEEETVRDIEGDPFYSGAHLYFNKSCNDFRVSMVECVFSGSLHLVLYMCRRGRSN